MRINYDQKRSYNMLCFNIGVVSFLTLRRFLYANMLG